MLWILGHSGFDPDAVPVFVPEDTVLHFYAMDGLNNLFSSGLAELSANGEVTFHAGEEFGETYYPGEPMHHWPRNYRFKALDADEEHSTHGVISSLSRHSNLKWVGRDIQSDIKLCTNPQGCSALAGVHRCNGILRLFSGQQIHLIGCRSLSTRAALSRDAREEEARTSTPPVLRDYGSSEDSTGTDESTWTDFNRYISDKVDEIQQAMASDPQAGVDMFLELTEAERAMLLRSRAEFREKIERYWADQQAAGTTGWFNAEVESVENLAKFYGQVWLDIRAQITVSPVRYLCALLIGDDKYLSWPKPEEQNCPEDYMTCTGRMWRPIFSAWLRGPFGASPALEGILDIVPNITAMKLRSADIQVGTGETAERYRCLLDFLELCEGGTTHVVPDLDPVLVEYLRERLGDYHEIESMLGNLESALRNPGSDLGEYIARHPESSLQSITVGNDELDDASAEQVTENVRAQLEVDSVAALAAATAAAQRIYDDCDRQANFVWSRFVAALVNIRPEDVQRRFVWDLQGEWNS